MRTFVYVDGFNLYYGALKGSSWKWLDLVTLFEKVLQPHHQLLAVKYFTARVSGTARNPSKPQRQDVYLRALRRYRPQVEVYFGHFLSHSVRAPLAQPEGNRRTAEVIRTEEKGSDVNLAVHLLNDGWLDAYDCAVVVTNDSDIAEAMRLVNKLTISHYFPKAALSFGKKWPRTFGNSHSVGICTGIRPPCDSRDDASAFPLPRRAKPHKTRPTKREIPGGTAWDA